MNIEIKSDIINDLFIEQQNKVEIVEIISDNKQQTVEIWKQQIIEDPILEN